MVIQATPRIAQKKTADWRNIIENQQHRFVLFTETGDSLFTSYGHLWSFATAFSKSSIKVFVLLSADLAGHILVDSWQISGYELSSEESHSRSTLEASSHG